MRKLLIITESPFNSRDYERLRINWLLSIFDVRVLDCTKWLKPEVAAMHLDEAHPFLGCSSVGSRSEFKKALSECKGAIAIDCLGPQGKAEWIRRMLHSQGILLTKLVLGALPVLDNLHASERKLINIVRSPYNWTKLIRLKDKFVRSIMPWRLVISDIVVLGGDVGLSYPWVQHVRFKVPAHSLDYELFLQKSCENKATQLPYAVFLDEDMIHHGDFLHHGIKPPILEEDYYPALNKFFDIVETHLGMKVVFAAHPQSRYDLRPHLLKGRSFVLGKTAELVRDAALVFMHASTSQSYAVLWK